MKQAMRSSRRRWALAVVALTLPAWAGNGNDAEKEARKAKPGVEVRDPITPEMVRKVSGPTRPDNGALEIQPGLPPKKCAKEDKHDKDKKPEKSGRRKGHC